MRRHWRQIEIISKYKQKDVLRWSKRFVFNLSTSWRYTNMFCHILKFMYCNEAQWWMIFSWVMLYIFHKKKFSWIINLKSQQRDGILRYTYVLTSVISSVTDRKSLWNYKNDVMFDQHHHHHWSDKQTPQFSNRLGIKIWKEKRTIQICT